MPEAPRYYILKGKAVRKTDRLTWFAFIKEVGFGLRIAYDNVQSVNVSTVFFGFVNARRPDEYPFFKTHIAGGLLHGEWIGSNSYDEAIENHKRIVEGEKRRKKTGADNE